MGKLTSKDNSMHKMGAVRYGALIPTKLNELGDLTESFSVEEAETAATEMIIEQGEREVYVVKVEVIRIAHEKPTIQWEETGKQTQ